MSADQEHQAYLNRQARADQVGHLAQVYAAAIMAALIGRWDNYLDSELVVRASVLAEKLAEEMVP